MSERPRWQALFPEGPPRRICIVMLSAIGDAVHVLPVANALKRHWPECRITWVIQPVPHRLVADHPAIDDFLIFHRRRGIDAWEGFRDLARQYPQRPYDLVLGLQVYFKAGVLTGLAPARSTRFTSAFTSGSPVNGLLIRTASPFLTPSE